MGVSGVQYTYWTMVAARGIQTATTTSARDPTGQFLKGFRS
jgi:hypothetical protein